MYDERDGSKKQNQAAKTKTGERTSENNKSGQPSFLSPSLELGLDERRNGRALRREWLVRLAHGVKHVNGVGELFRIVALVTELDL